MNSAVSLYVTGNGHSVAIKYRILFVSLVAITVNKYTAIRQNFLGLRNFCQWLYMKKHIRRWYKSVLKLSLENV
jgi:hypothetical protein